MDEQMKRLALWNRVWLTLSVVLALAWGFGRVVEHVFEDSSTVKSSWDGETLRFSSLQGRVVISHLQSYSAERLVGARLPTPLFILDSGPVTVDPTTWKALEWRDDAGSVQPPPPVGAPVKGLYTRLERTR